MIFNLELNNTNLKSIIARFCTLKKNYLNASLYDLVKEKEEINKESIFKLLEGFKLSAQERQKNSSFDFCDLIGEFIDLGISGKIKKKDGNKYTKTTLIKGYGNLQKHICSYEKENGSRELLCQ